MNELQVFNNPEFGEMRSLEIKGEPWFVGKDVATILGYAKPLNALATHIDEDDSLKQGLIDSMGRMQETIFINESGLYSLILSSKLPKAKEFKRWITSEVLPSIRKHGVYMTPNTIEDLIANPDTIIQLATALKEERNKRKELEIDNQVMQPKADYFDELVDRKLLTNFTEASKELGIKRKVLIGFLLENDYIYRDKKGNILPCANKKSEGLFEVKQSLNKKTSWSGCQTLLTPKGVETFRLLCKNIKIK